MRKPMKSFVTEDPCFLGVLGVVLGMLAFFVGVAMASQHTIQIRLEGCGTSKLEGAE